MISCLAVIFLALFLVLLLPRRSFGKRKRGFRLTFSLFAEIELSSNTFTQTAFFVWDLQDPFTFLSQLIKPHTVERTWQPVNKQ